MKRVLHRRLALYIIQKFVIMVIKKFAALMKIEDKEGILNNWSDNGEEGNKWGTTNVAVKERVS